MRVLVTGGAGFIGSHVVDAFVTAGHDVAVVDNLSTGRRRNLNPAARFYEADIRAASLAAIFERERPEVVSHHAAQVDVRRSVAEPGYDADVNVAGSIRVLECARRYGVRKVVYASSVAVYGEPAYLPCDEAHAVAPLSPYGASKHIVEHYLAIYRHVHGVDYAVLRYANVYGPRQDPHGEAGVVAIFAGRMLGDAAVTIHGSGEQERDFLFVADCARANLLAAGEGLSGLYGLGSGVGTSINGLFAMLAGLTGYARQPIHGPAKPGETFRIFLDSAKAKEALGWQPSATLREGLERTLAYFREEGLAG